MIDREAMRQALNRLISAQENIFTGRDITEIESAGDLWPETVALRATLAQQAEPASALTRYNEIAANPEIYTGDPLERLRIFCSLAMTENDWVDAEPFFDAVETYINVLEQAEPVTISGAIAMADSAVSQWWDSSYSRAMPERAKSLERARERRKQAEPVVTEPIATVCREADRQQIEFHTYIPEGETWRLYAMPPMQAAASLMTNFQSGDVELVWNDDGFSKALWRETVLYKIAE